MSDDAKIVIHGFFDLTNLEKLEIVNAINEYFDSNDRESIRARHDAEFEAVKTTMNGRKCKCCGR